MIIMHGEQDPVVPIKQSKKLYKALVAAEADVTYLSCSNGGHGPSLEKAADGLAYRFLMDHL